MGGDIADILTINNSMDIDRLQQMQRAQMKMAELRERREEIGRTTGKMPLSYFAFERAHPTRLERTKNGVLGGAALGALTGALLGSVAAVSPRRASSASALITGAGIGAAAGAVIGAHTNEREESRIDRSLLKYEAYINGFEVAMEAGETGYAAKLRPATALTHTQTVAAERASATTDKSLG